MRVLGKDLIWFDCIWFPDGNWTRWTAWSKCTRLCGGGIQSRSRTCTNPQPSFGGSYCHGKSLERRPCNSQECTGKREVCISKWVGLDNKNSLKTLKLCLHYSSNQHATFVVFISIFQNISAILNRGVIKISKSTSIILHLTIIVSLMWTQLTKTFHGLIFGRVYNLGRVFASEIWEAYFRRALLLVFYGIRVPYFLE